MKKSCKLCKRFFKCELKQFLPFPEAGCSAFCFAKKHYIIVIHQSKLNNSYSILGFVDTYAEAV